MISHYALAKALKIPELELTSNESEKLTCATLDLLDHYNVVIDPKITAAIALIAVSGEVYGGKFIAYKLRAKEMNKDENS